jgi:hypothetical protein
MSTPGTPGERKPLTSFLKLQESPNKKAAPKGSSAPISNDKKIGAITDISKAEPNFHSGALKLSEEEGPKA